MVRGDAEGEESEETEAGGRGMSEKIKGAKLIARARQEAENRRIRDLSGAAEVKDFDPASFIRTWGVSEEDRHSFPPISPLDLAGVAGPLLPIFGGSAAKACAGAAELIRAAAVQIERERSKDERNLGFLADNEANRRMWRNLGKRIEDLYSSGMLRGEPFRNSLPNPFGGVMSLDPFPISMKEISTVAGLEESTGLKRINAYVRKAVREGHESQCEHAKLKGEAMPEPLTAEVEKIQFNAWKDSFKVRGIYQPVFLDIAKTWPELQRVLSEFRKES
jgi:hypothetical protein